MTSPLRSLLLATLCTLIPLSAAEAATLRLAMGSEPVSLDPIASSDNGSIWTQLLIFDTLIRPDTKGTGLEPGLAENWTVSPDGHTMSFKLRQAKFSDGTPVTAEDVQFSIQRAAGENSGWARFFKPITGFRIVSPTEIEMTLDKPFTPAFNNLALFSAAILPKAQVEAQGDAFFEHPIGSGPFVLDTWQRGSAVTLKKNPNYWQAGKPAIDGAELQIVADASARVLKLEAGETDVILDPPANQMKSLADTAGITVGQTTPLRSDFVQLNTSKPPFDKVEVRQALNYAVDKDALIKGVLYGAGTVAASTIPVMNYADPALAPYPYDPAKAKQMLQEAGVSGPIEAALLVDSGNAAARNTAIALQGMLGQVGVNLKIQSLESGTQFETTKAGNYDTSLAYATSDTIDPDQMLGFLAVNPERQNAFHTRWASDRVNALYEDERSTVDGPERGKMFQEMVQILHDESPYIFLYHPNAAWAVRDGVTGFSILPTSNFRLEDVTIAQ